MNGLNTNSCGSKVDPCKEIEHVIYNIINENDTIILKSSPDGTFIIKQSIKPNISFTLRNERDEHVKSNIALNSGLYMIILDSTKKIDISLLNIRFKNTRIASHESGQLTINMRNCFVEHSGYSFVFHSKVTSPNKGYFMVNFINSDVHINDGLFFLVEQSVQVTLNVENAILSGGRIFYTIKLWYSQPADEIRLKNVTFKNIANSVIELSNMRTVSLENVTFNDIKGTLNVVTIYGHPNNKIYNRYLNTVQINGIYFNSIQTHRLLFDLKDMDTVLNRMTVSNARNLSAGLSLERCIGRIDEYTSIDSEYSGKFIYAKQNDMTIGRMLFENNTNLKTDGVFTSENRFTIEDIRFKRNTMRNRPFVLIRSTTIINNIVFANNNLFQLVEALRSHFGLMTITHLVFENNLIKQGVLVTNGSCIIRSGVFNNNTANSTLIGTRTSMLTLNQNIFNVSSILFQHNNISGNIAHLIGANTTILRNITLIANEYATGLNLERTNIDVDGVYINGNAAKGRWKALQYNDGNEPFVANFQNVHAVFHYHEKFNEHDTALDIQVNDHSNVTMKNIRIELKDMILPITSVAFLSLGTTNLNVKPDITVICSTNYNPKVNEIFTDSRISQEISCDPCQRGLYSIENSRVSTTKINNEGIDVQKWTRDYPHLPMIQKNETRNQCKLCPSGGNCNNVITSNGNFFGYKVNESTVQFLPCPKGYCCSNAGQQCTGISTCNFNRKGRLCGECKEGYYEHYFSTACVLKKKCTMNDRKSFWTVFILTALLFTLALCFTKDIVTILKFLKNKIKHYFKPFSSIPVAMQNKVRLSSVTCDTEVEESDSVFHESTNEMSTPKNPNRSTKRVSSVFQNDIIDLHSDKRKFTIAAVIQIIVSFYQMRTLILIDSGSQTNVSDTSNVLSKICNFELFIRLADSICPFHHVDAVTKLLLKNIVFTLTMICMTLLAIFVSYGARRFFKSWKIQFQNKSPFSISALLKELTTLPLYQKFMVCFLKVLIFAYKNLSLFAVVATNCVNINNKEYLFVSANIKCYQNWQYANFIFLIFWVLPFPLSLTCLYYLLKKKVISSWIFTICLLFPVFTPFLLFASREKTKITFTGSNHDEEFQKVLHEFFEEPYRRTTSTRALYWWQTWRLYERLLVVAISVYVIDPITRMSVVTPVILLLLWMHIYMKPYKSEMTLLSLLDVTSYICLCVQVVNSTFQSVLYTFDIPIQKPIDVTLVAFEYFVVIFSPLVLLVMYVAWTVIVLILKKAQIVH